ncbi:MAG: hypothetical protein FRX49_00874 [Trebouxia sp. A1-2]|nr:MAG: hypothetical protein FRX49_00874 [Trebouxia sp. A1-2]
MVVGGDGGGATVVGVSGGLGGGGVVEGWEAVGVVGWGERRWGWGGGEGGGVEEGTIALQDHEHSYKINLGCSRVQFKSATLDLFCMPDMVCQPAER